LWQLAGSIQEFASSTIAAALGSGSTISLSIDLFKHCSGELAVAPGLTVIARRLGIVSAAGTVFLLVVYAIMLVEGLVSLQSPEQPIGDPLFSILEILIILMMPVMVALMVAVHAWTSPETKTSV
jgi:hypothetical protein